MQNIARNVIAKNTKEGHTNTHLEEKTIIVLFVGEHLGNVQSNIVRRCVQQKN